MYHGASGLELQESGDEVQAVLLSVFHKIKTTQKLKYDIPWESKENITCVAICYH